MPSQFQPLSHLYGSSAEDMHAMNNNHLEMPDPNEFIRPTVSRGIRRRSSHPSQLTAQPPPYPVHDKDEDMSPIHAVYNSHRVFIRQPTVEDFLPKRQSLSPQPVGEHRTKQGSPVTEPDSGLQRDSCHKHVNHPTDPQLTDLNEGASKRRSKGSNHSSRRVSELGTTNEGSRSESRPHSNTSSRSSKASSCRGHGRVQPISSDTYQPTLGGLHKISDLQRKDSKRDKVKRTMSKLNPLRRQRRSWG